MKKLAWQLPWSTIEDTPHGLLDILRGCNIRCKACYNQVSEGVKSVAEIEQELDTMMSLRKVQSISLVGGEVTLHPNLCEIVCLIKSRGLCVELFTNGILLDETMLAALKEAGADLIFLHIDSGQYRPDIADPGSLVERRELTHKKAEQIASFGIDVGLTMTAYNEGMEEVGDAIETVLQSPFLNYLLVTVCRDLSDIASIEGNLESGMLGQRKHGVSRPADGMNIRQIHKWVLGRFGFHPFACIGSNVDANDPRWLSYLIATHHRKDKLEARLSMKVSLCEKLFLAWSHFRTGRYPMYQRPDEKRSRLQVLMNTWTGGRILAGLAFLLKVHGEEGHLHLKRILFQCPAFVDEEGRVVHCNNCPDAVVKYGGLVPVCICDHVQPPKEVS